MLGGTLDDGPHPQERQRNVRRARKLWHQPKLTPSLGCIGCRERGDCGGLQTEASVFDCMTHCCRQPETCTKMCRAKPRDFALKLREISGFDLSNIPSNAGIYVPPLPRCVPVLFHGNKRDRKFPGDTVALSLYRIINKSNGIPRFSTHEEVCEAYNLNIGTRIILTGTEQDPPLERWWRYGSGRVDILAKIANLGVVLATTPNFSLFPDTPRWDDLHSMKRIGIVHSEFMAAGIASALHVNGRTDTDFLRWAHFLNEHEETTHIAYEFTTGSGWARRANLHADWLSELASRVNRPLHLVMRGGIELLPPLGKAFANITVLETSAFMKTMKRQRATVEGNSRIVWSSCPTEHGIALDDLFEFNVATTRDMISMLCDDIPSR